MVSATLQFSPMDILFVHQNFPAQFVHVARALNARPGLRVAAISHKANEQKDFLPGARYGWESKRAGTPNQIAANFALRASQGRMAAKAMIALRDRGFNPKLIVGHLGWGETLFAKDVFPDATLVVHAEFFYSAVGADVGFDPEFVDGGVERRFELRAKNAAILAAMNDADFAVVPTRWQASRFPAYLQSKLNVIHEGIDTNLVRPNAAATFRVAGTDIAFKAGDEVLTFVNRNLEPYRGYHIFMRALPAILAERPGAQAVIVGGDSVSYGAAAPQGQSWKEIFLSEVRGRLPLERVHFVDKIPFADFVSLMQVSAAHVYLTYPFVLSWSMLQAMSAGAPLIASSTAPVVEVVQDRVNGVLVDFFATEALAQRVIDVLAHPADYTAMREAARRTIVESYDLDSRCLPRWLDLLGNPGSQ
jgi:glycosyltransferase involved in cell wall biosynthesis